MKDSPQILIGTSNAHIEMARAGLVLAPGDGLLPQGRQRCARMMRLIGGSAWRKSVTIYGIKNCDTMKKARAC